MNPKFKGVLVGLLLLVIGFFASACRLGGDDAAAPAVPSITANSSPSSSAAQAAAGGVPKDVQVQGNDDELEEVPWVAGENITDGDTRDSTSMPSLHKLLPNCGVLVDWQSLVDCVNEQKNAQWYIDGINQRTDITRGATWDDIVKMAKAKTPSGNKPAGVRVIQVYGWTEAQKSKAEARKAVAPLVGEETASKMEVVYYNVDAYANTWRTAGNKPAMQTFADYNREIRATLAPLKLNPDGTVAGRIEGVPWGVFIDCYNLHGFFKLVPKTPKSQLLCPPGTPNVGKPMVSGCYPGQPPPVCKNGKCTPSGGCKYKCTPPVCKVTPCKPPEECNQPNNCKPGKDPSLDPEAQGSNKPEHGGTSGPQPDPIGSPGGGQPPATYTPPATTQPTTPRPTPPPPVETPAPQPSNPAPPGDPCEENPNLPVCD